MVSRWSVMCLSQGNASPTLSWPLAAMQTGYVRMRRLALTLLVLFVVGCTTAPGSSGAASPVSSAVAARTPGAAGAAAARPTGWPEYHGNAARTGDAGHLPKAGKLSVAWSRRLSGAVYGQPLVVGNTVIVGTEADEVLGLNWANGRVLWHATVGTPLPLAEQPCGNIDPLGITGTGVYDSQTKLAYFVAQSGRTTHVLVGVRVTNGKVAFRRDVPSPDHEPFYDQQRGALALERGRVYVVFGGHDGDCGPYRGSVVGVPASGRGAIVSFVVPTSRQAGIWGTGGPVIASNGTIYVSDGNGAVTEKSFDDSDAVIALTPALRRIGVFAPTDWRTLSADDLDLGSMSPALMSDGRILQVGKSAVGYLLNDKRLGGVGGQLASGPVCPAFGGAAVSGETVYVPCISGGTAAVDTAGTRVRVLWRGPSAGWGSPVIGGGAVWVAGPDTGVLYELAPATGKVRHSIRLGGSLPDFASPTLSGRLVLVGTRTGVVAVAGA
jgi:polyvinyl alcohol dehydrogenase (cytochrome)